MLHFFDQGNIYIYRERRRYFLSFFLTYIYAYISNISNNLSKLHKRLICALEKSRNQFIYEEYFYAEILFNKIQKNLDTSSAL